MHTWRRRGSRETPLPNLLPLLVVLLPILFFYARMFHASGECLCSRRVPIVVPIATQVDTNFEPAPIIEIDLTREVRLNSVPQKSIVALADDLITLRNNFALLHPGSTAPLRSYLVADARLPFGAINFARHALAIAGYAPADYVVQMQDDPWSPAVDLLHR